MATLILCLASMSAGSLLTILVVVALNIGKHDSPRFSFRPMPVKWNVPPMETVGRRLSHADLVQMEQEKKNKEKDEDDGEIQDERCIDCYQSVDVLEHGRGKTPCERGEKCPYGIGETKDAEETHTN